MDKTADPEGLTLPEGWHHGPLGHGSAMANFTYHREDEDPKRWRLVRFDYTVDGFRAYLWDPNNAPHRGHVGRSQPIGTWYAHPTCPVLDDPVAVMVWLEVSDD